MKSFVIFAIVVTVIYIIYYTVIIVQDLYGKPKDEKSQGESFDVSDMTDEDDSVTVSENEGGFSVGESQYQTMGMKTKRALGVLVGSSGIGFIYRELRRFGRVDG